MRGVRGAGNFTVIPGTWMLSVMVSWWLEAVKNQEPKTQRNTRNTRLVRTSWNYFEEPRKSLDTSTVSGVPRIPCVLNFSQLHVTRSLSGHYGLVVAAAGRLKTRGKFKPGSAYSPAIS